MSRVAVNFLVEISYDMKNPDKTVVRTNTKMEGVKEILETWLQCQVGKGEDKSKASEKDEYKVQIGLELDKDIFHINSDAGNKGLTCGIIIDVLSRLEKLEILSLT